MTRPVPPDLALDGNADGVIGIGDASFWVATPWEWAKWVFFAPGDTVTVVIIVESSEIANRFGMTTGWYGGWFAGLVSTFVWALFLAAIALWVRRGRHAPSRRGEP